jgi:signal transduction histidine kinase
MSDINIPNRRILLIDDNSSIHEDFRKILAAKDAGISVIDAQAAILFDEAGPAPAPVNFALDFALQGEEALAKVRQSLARNEPYAVAFVDMRMPPGWDGLETIRRLWQVYPDLETVICTAYSDHSWQQIHRTLGSSDQLLILKKPFDKVEVQQLALALTEKWNLRRLARLHTAGLEELVRQRTREMLHADRAKSEFLANISYELLTPMNGILGNVDVMTTTALNEEQKTVLADLRHSGERLLGLIQGVLKFNTIESGKLQLQSVPFDVRALCQSAADGQAAKARAKNLELKVSVADHGSSQAQGDPEQIKQVLALLLDNAIKFTERGAVTIQVRPAGTTVRALEFAVTDTGCGIPPERLETLKYPLSQIDSSLTRVADGIGLGLTLAKKLVGLMGGWLEFQSKPGRGSTFRFTLPVDASVQPIAA